MSRVSGIIAGLVIAVCALVIGWSFGWVRFGATPGPAPTMEAGAMDHAAGQPPPSPAPADEHAEHAPTAAAPATEPSPAGQEAGMPQGAVMIPPQRQQLIGVRTAPVVREVGRRTIRTVGEVEYDERLVAHIHTKVSGWIEKLEIDFTGKLVEAGQPLLEIYSPELVSTQEEYLLALRARRTLGDSSFADVASTSRSLLEATRRRLELWDITPEQITRLEERGEPERTVRLHSPISGFVTHKMAYEGQFVGPQNELFTIADLSRVWVMADVYESEISYVRVGQPATVTLSYLPQQRFRGTVDYVYPYLAGETRTAKVRVVLFNPDATFKPDMFANVELDFDLGPSLLVPEDAVIDSGTRQVVILVLPDNHFLPREVEVGARFDDRLQILSGLEVGDVVVSGATFLIDSESKLSSALRSMTGHQH